MEVLLQRHFPLQRVADAHAVLGHHVPVVERMRHEHGRLHVAHKGQQVARDPECVVVAGAAIAAFDELAIAIDLVADGAAHRVAAVDEVVQEVDVLSEPSPRVPHQTVGTVVVVIRRVGCDGDDRFEPGNSSRGCGEGNGPVVRRARHADLAGSPGGFHFFCAIGCRETFCAAVQPVDDGLGREPLGRAADRGTSLRQPGARRFGMHHREPTRHPRSHLRVGNARARRVELDLGLRGTCRRIHAHFLLHVPEELPVAGRAGEVGRRLIHHGHLQPFRVGL